MTRTFNKMGKIVAVSVGIVLMGAIFSGCGFMESVFGGDSTSTQSSSTTSSTAKKKDSNIFSSFFGTDDNDNVNREKCSGDEIKENYRLAKGTCNNGIKEGIWKYYDNSGYIVEKEVSYKKGVLDGITKIYDKDENLIKEISYKDGKLNGTYTSYDKKDLGDNSFYTKMATDYVDDKVMVVRKYIGNSIAYFEQTKIENGIEITSTYDFINEISKNLEKTLLPKLKAKYEKSLNEATNNDKQTRECMEAIGEVERYNKGETRIYPSAQTIKKAQECKVGYADALGALFGGANTNKVKTQMQKEYSSAVLAEFKKNGHKFSDDTKVLSYIKGKYPTIEIIKTTKLQISTKGNETKFAEIGKNFSGEITDFPIGFINHNTKNIQDACKTIRDGNCRAFSRQFKELIDKSFYKDKIYNLLPKPKNQ